MRGALNGRTRRAASRKMWEKANVGVRMTANSIPGALWLLRWQTHTLRFLLGSFDYGFFLRRGALGELFRITLSLHRLK